MRITVRALTINISGPITVRDVPVPEPGPDDLLVRLTYSGVCHSDLHVYLGEFAYPLEDKYVGGHEGVCSVNAALSGVGVVVKKGANVTNFEIGDLAGIRVSFIHCLTL